MLACALWKLRVWYDHELEKGGKKNSYEIARTRATEYSDANHLFKKKNDHEQKIPVRRNKTRRRRDGPMKFDLGIFFSPSFFLESWVLTKNCTFENFSLGLRLLMWKIFAPFSWHARARSCLIFQAFRYTRQFITKKKIEREQEMKKKKIGGILCEGFTRLADLFFR